MGIMLLIGMMADGKQYHNLYYDIQSSFCQRVKHTRWEFMTYAHQKMVKEMKKEESSEAILMEQAKDFSI